MKSPCFKISCFDVSYKFIAVLFLVLLLVSIMGCGPQRVYKVEHRPTFANKEVSLKQIGQYIQEAGEIIGWKFEPGSDNELIGSLSMKRGRAYVRIQYDRTTYNIFYKDSLDLRYDPDKGTIHGSYNKMVRNLDNAIRVKLRGLSTM